MGRRRRTALLLSLSIYALDLALLLGALFTDFWLAAGPLLRHGRPQEASRFHSGLFGGVRELDSGFGPVASRFSVYDEFVRGVSFAEKHSWLLLVFLAFLGLLWTCVAGLVALLAWARPARNSVVGPRGLHLWNGLACGSNMAALWLFLQQFHGRITENVLLEDHLLAGFSSAGCVRLGTSFWTFSVATLLPLLPSALVLLTEERSKKLAEVRTIDPTALMY